MLKIKPNDKLNKVDDRVDGLAEGLQRDRLTQLEKENSKLH